jgi:hypothetical protein
MRTHGRLLSHMYEYVGLCDVEHIQLVPTWRNLRSGKDGVSKNLDRFMVEENILK